jgi:hypothetical protein
MKPCLAFLALLLVLAPAPAQSGGSAGGQPPFKEGLAAPSGPPKSPTVEPIKLTIRPAAAPVPALKYRLLPQLRELKRGNAVFLYYRAFSPEWAGVWRRPEVAKRIDAWADDRRKVPGEELRWVLADNALKEIDRGARRTYVDWEMNDRLREDGIFMLLPEIQSFRQFANLLAARARLEMAGGQLDKAAYTLQTGAKLGRDVGKGPTLIQSLVGIAITTVMLEQAEEFIQTPKSPNLYWALTNLPAPFVDLRNAYEGELTMVDSLFPGIREKLADPKARPMSDAEVRDVLDRLAGQLEEGRLTPSHYDWRARLQLATLAAMSYPEARRFLLAQGRSAKDVNAMPVVQAALMYEVHNYDRFYDDFAKWTALPYWQARPRLLQAERNLKQAKAAGPSTGTTLAALLLPAVLKVQWASARTDRRIAALRCVEALRLHAAAHDGKLPARLDDIKVVPVPLDPVTGRAFDYTVDGDRAVLSGPPPAGEEARVDTTLRYELTLAH